MLEIALIGHHFGRLPSELLEVKDSALAFSYDRAASLKLLNFHSKMRRADSRLTGIACGMAFNGQTLELEDDQNTEECTWDAPVMPKNELRKVGEAKVD